MANEDIKIVNPDGTAAADSATFDAGLSAHMVRV